MRAISLWQPWADLIAWGYKTMETRLWPTHHRGDLLICSAKRYDRVVKEHIDMFRLPDAWELLFDAEAGYPQLPMDYEPRLGQALAIVDVVDCITLSEELKQREQWRRAACFPCPYATDGEWSLEGRYGWVLENIRPLDVPFAIKGKQGFFEVDLETQERVTQVSGAEQMGLF